MIEDIYIVMNKPCGYVCSTMSDRSHVVFELIDPMLLEECRKNGKNLHTVGRLDKETEGLLILTTDGKFSHNLTVPSHCVNKVYRVVLRDPVDKKGQNEYAGHFAEGVVLPPEKKFPEQLSRPAKIRWISPAEAEVTVTEGKFHQVRRMFMAMNNEVVKLKRIAVDFLYMEDSLKSGEYRYLVAEEVLALKKNCEEKKQNR